LSPPPAGGEQAGVDHCTPCGEWCTSGAQRDCHSGDHLNSAQRHSGSIRNVGHSSALVTRPALAPARPHGARVEDEGHHPSSTPPPPADSGRAGGQPGRQRARVARGCGGRRALAVGGAASRPCRPSMPPPPPPALETVEHRGGGADRRGHSAGGRAAESGRCEHQCRYVKKPSDLTSWRRASLSSSPKPNIL